MRSPISLFVVLCDVFVIFSTLTYISASSRLSLSLSLEDGWNDHGTNLPLRIPSKHPLSGMSDHPPPSPKSLDHETPIPNPPRHRPTPSQRSKYPMPEFKYPNNPDLVAALAQFEANQLGASVRHLAGHIEGKTLAEIDQYIGQLGGGWRINEHAEGQNNDQTQKQQRRVSNRELKRRNALTPDQHRVHSHPHSSASPASAPIANPLSTRDMKWHRLLTYSKTEVDQHYYLIFYYHQDGGMVKVKPLGSPNKDGRTGGLHNIRERVHASIAVRFNPRLDALNGGLAYINEAFKVCQGRPVPKSYRFAKLPQHLIGLEELNRLMYIRGVEEWVFASGYLACTHLQIAAGGRMPYDLRTAVEPKRWESQEIRDD